MPRLSPTSPKRWAWLGALPLLGCSVLFGDDLGGLSAADPGGAGGAGGGVVEGDEVSGGVVRVVHAAQARPCSGVVVASNWVLTAARCVATDDVEMRVEHVGPGATGPASAQVVERQWLVLAPEDPLLVLLRLSAPVDGDAGGALRPLWWRDTADLAGKPLRCHGHREAARGSPPRGSEHLAEVTVDEIGLMPDPSGGPPRSYRGDMIYLEQASDESLPPLAPGGGCFTPDGELAAIVVDPTASTGPGEQVGVSLASFEVRAWIERTLLSTPEPPPFAALPLGAPGASRAGDGQLDVLWAEDHATLAWSHFGPSTSPVVRHLPPVSDLLPFIEYRPSSCPGVRAGETEFAVLVGSERIVRSTYRESEGWSSWRDTGQLTSLPPVLARWRDGRTAMLLTVGQEVRFRLEDPASQEGEWQGIGDGVHGPPAAVSGSSGLHVFAHRWEDGRVLYKRYTGSWWPSPTAWHELPLEMPCYPGLAATMAPDGMVELFARDCATSTLLHARQRGNWHGWIDTRIPMSTTPAAVSDDTGRQVLLWSDLDTRSLRQAHFPR